MPVTNYYTVNGEIIAEKTTGGQRIDYLTDPLGSVLATMNQNAQLVNTYRYKPFGGLLAKTGVGADPSFQWIGNQGYRQTGKKYSDVYVRSRHYETLDGRWATKDALQSIILQGHAGPSPWSPSCASVSRIDRLSPLCAMPPGYRQDGENPYAYVLNRTVRVSDPSGFGRPAGCFEGKPPRPYPDVPPGDPARACYFAACNTYWHWRNKLTKIQNILCSDILECGHTNMRLPDCRVGDPCWDSEHCDDLPVIPWWRFWEGGQGRGAPGASWEYCCNECYIRTCTWFVAPNIRYLDAWLQLAFRLCERGQRPQGPRPMPPWHIT